MIPDERRRSESEFSAALDEVRPRIVGALLDAYLERADTAARMAHIG